MYVWSPSDSAAIIQSKFTPAVMEQSNQNAHKVALLKVSETAAPTNNEDQQQEAEVSKRDANQSRTSEFPSTTKAAETTSKTDPTVAMGEASSLKRPAHCLSGGDTTTITTTNNDTASNPTTEQNSNISKATKQLKAAPAPPAAAAPTAKQPATKKKKRSSAAAKKEGASSGRWTPAEHAAFLQGLAVYGREWKRVAADIPTRSASQVRSHAQKYFSKLQKEQEEEWIHNNSVNETLAGSIIPGDPDDASQQHQHQQQPPQFPDSVRREAARILAHPETVEAEVRSTLQQLRERYAQLQQRLEERSVGSRNSHSAVSAEDEMIALHVLQGGLKHNSNSDQDASVHSSNHST